MKKNSTVFVGLDLGDRMSNVCMLDPDGEIICESRIQTTPECLSKFFGALDPCVVAFEVGTHSRWVQRVISEGGHDTFVANAHKLKLIYDNPKKTDRMDAENLARLARLDPKLLGPIQHRGFESQRVLACVRSRDLLVRLRSSAISSVRGQVKSFGGRLPTCSTESFVRKCEQLVPSELSCALGPLFESIRVLDQQIRELERELASLSVPHSEVVTRLTQIAGVGLLTAMTFMAVVEDPWRFANSRDIGSYLGLCDKRDDSGESRKQLRITKRGDGYLRKLLVGNANYVLGPFGPDTDLRRWGLSLQLRGGKNAKKRSMVAVARKLSILLLTLWQKGTDYVPLRTQPEAPAVETLKDGPMDGLPKPSVAKAVSTRGKKGGKSQENPGVSSLSPSAEPMKRSVGRPRKSPPAKPGEMAEQKGQGEQKRKVSAVG